MANPPRTKKSKHRLINDLQSHLFFLRRSLIDSFAQAVYYKQLAAELRVLIYEKPRSANYDPILLSLADTYQVQHQVTLDVPFPSQGYPFKTPGKGNLPFRDYLGLPVFGRGGNQVSASQLILDVASQTGAAHEDKSLSEYLPFASAPIKGVPYHLEVLQEVALRTLVFGDSVVQTALAVDGVPTEQNLEGEPLAPHPECSNCHSSLTYGEFVCHKCGHQHLSRSPQPDLATQFATILKTSGGISGLPAIMQGWYSIPRIFDPSAGRGILFDYSEGSLRLTLVRSEDFHLQFCRHDHDKVNCAQIDLSKVEPSLWIFLALVWSGNTLGLHLGSGGQLHSSEITV